MINLSEFEEWNISNEELIEIAKKYKFEDWTSNQSIRLSSIKGGKLATSSFLISSTSGRNRNNIICNKRYDNNFIVLITETKSDNQMNYSYNFDFFEEMFPLLKKLSENL